MQNKNIRNFSIIAHIDHGKSTIADRLIEYTGTLSKREMEAQVLDNMDIERERGITIKSQTVRLNYKGKDGEEYELNLIDTPGHVDFTYEVSRSLAACEGALLVVDAAQGVEAQTLANVYIALEKMQINDAALVFEPETSVALGFGFRCGFLGLLHMDVIQERLEREYNLKLITTAPSVIYHVYKTDGTMIKVSNPAELPPQTEIEHIEEPYVKATVIVPNDFVGAVMEISQDKRGEFKGMDYLDTNRVMITYHIPLNEIIFDYFDRLKSATRGYASLDYELADYKESKLVKVDILLNGDPVDALSTIVHKDRAASRGRQLAAKLKEIIPQQMFEIPIQAAIGSKVIARENVRPRRKDVLAKCYGGDISRKRKLLEKQKEGKKRMKAVGSVEVPQEAFMVILKID